MGVCVFYAFNPVNFNLLFRGFAKKICCHFGGREPKEVEREPLVEGKRDVVATCVLLRSIRLVKRGK